MSRPHLETFESAAASGADPAAAAALAEREAEYEAAHTRGFLAGRAAAEDERHEDENRLRSEIVTRLEALSFTWEEARSRLLIALEPLMMAIVGKVLPEVARRTLAPVVAERLMALAGEHADKPLMLMVHPAARAPVEALLGDMTRLPVKVTGNPGLGEGQVALHRESTEVMIDLDRVTAEIAAAVDAFFAMTREDAADGCYGRRQPLRTDPDRDHHLGRACPARGARPASP